MVNTNEYIQKWSEKLSMPADAIQKEFETLKNSEKELHPEVSEEDRSNRALQRLALSFKKQLRSPAVGFEGIIIAVGDVVDVVAKRRKEAIDFFNTNPQKAIEMGITDANGVPLETRKEWDDGRPNYNFGKPIAENSFLRNIWGVALKSNLKNDKPKFFSMSLNGEVAKNDTIPLFTPVRFRAIDKTPAEKLDKTYILNGSMFTKFDIDTTIQLPKIKDLLNSVCGDMVVKLSQLQDWHIAHKEEFNRLCIVEGDVSLLALEPTANGSRRLIIEDGDSMDLESKGVTCWIPSRVNLDFAEQSKVLVVGRTGQGFKKDEAGQKTEELGDLTLNAFGVYALPEFKIEQNVIPQSPQGHVEKPTADSW